MGIFPGVSSLKRKTENGGVGGEGGEGEGGGSGGDDDDDANPFVLNPHSVSSLYKSVLNANEEEEEEEEDVDIELLFAGVLEDKLNGARS